MALADAILAIKAQLAALDVVDAGERRQQGQRPTATVQRTGIAEFLRGRYYLVDATITIPPTSTFTSEARVDSGVQVAEALADWIKTQLNIGDMLVYWPVGLTTSIDFDPAQAAAVIVVVTIPLTQEYPH